jgi:enediyne biosynthesis protein E4
VLGLGTATTVEWLEIEWPPPTGRVERFTDVAIDRCVRIVEGTGKIET